VKISEIFYSIEGEGVDCGKPKIFVRLAKCNLNCLYCDTKYSLKEGKERSIEEIMNEIKRYPALNVSITGGEPLLQQEELSAFVVMLKKNGYKVSVETNGTIKPSKTLLNNVDLWNVSPKLKSFEPKYPGLVFPVNLKNVCFKFVITKIPDDFELLDEFITVFRIPRDKIILQPNWFTIDFSELVRRVLHSPFCYRVLPQIHKIAGVR